jgi:hypothetical protein
MSIGKLVSTMLIKTNRPPHDSDFPFQLARRIWIINPFPFVVDKISVMDRDANVSKWEGPILKTKKFFIMIFTFSGSTKAEYFTFMKVNI